MASLTIPARHKPIFQELLALPSEELGRLLSALEALQPRRLDSSHLARELASTSVISEDSAEALLEMLVSMLGIPQATALGRDELAPGIMEALTREGAFSADADQLEDFRPFLEGALALDSSLGLIAKATYIAASNDRLFCGVTILTDLRPVFLDDDGDIETPAALMGTHTLRISFHKSNFELDDFYISLGAKDLEKIAETVERAQRKEKSMRQVAESSGVPFLAREDEQC